MNLNRVNSRITHRIESRCIKCGTSRAQTSVEVTVIFGLLLLVFVGVFASSSTILTGTRLTQEQRLTRVSLDSIAQTASQVYMEGNGSKRVIFIELPDVVNASSASSRTISFTLLAQNNLGQVLARSTDVDVSGSLPSGGGTWQVTMSSNGTTVIIS